MRRAAEEAPTLFEVELSRRFQQLPKNTRAMLEEWLEDKLNRIIGGCQGLDAEMSRRHPGKTLGEMMVENPIVHE